MLRTARTLLTLSVLSLLFPGSSQAGKIGPEFRVNTTIDNSFTAFGQFERAPAVASSSTTGNFVVVWGSGIGDGSSVGVFGQRFAPDGSKLGGQFKVNTFTSAAQNTPAVAAAANGDFVVTWHSFGQDGSGYGVFGQRYAADGTARGSEFRVNNFTFNHQMSSAVSSAPGGDFVVVWNSQGQDGSLNGVLGRRYAADGTALGNEFTVNSFTPQAQSAPAVATAPSGNFVVVWNSDTQDGNSTGVFGRRFAANGTPQGTEFRVNSFTARAQAFPSVATAANGDFMVVWHSDQVSAFRPHVYARRFAADATPYGPEQQVNTFTGNGFTLSNGRTFADVATTATGDFVVSWQSHAQDGSEYGIVGRQLGPDGTPRAGEFLVNTYTTSQQVAPAVAATGSNFVVVWRNSPVIHVTETDGQLFEDTCKTFTLSPSSTSVGVMMTIATLNVTGPSCPWTAVPNASWIHVSLPGTGNGNGTVEYMIEPNYGASRTGTITIAGKTFTVQQSGCAYTINPTGVGVGAGAGAGAIHVSTNDPGCPWTATSNAAWLTITSGGSGMAGGTVTYAVAANTGARRTGTLTVAGQTFTVVQANAMQHGDGNGDGRADILWRHATSGEDYLWMMNGTTLAGAGSIGGVPDTSWKIAGQGDYNGDGKSDVLWHNSADGQVYVWLMDGLTVTSTGSVGTVADLDWQIVGSRDNDGDGKSDVLWWNSTTGEVYLWTMNGLTYTGASVGTVADTNWRIVGTGDYDGDGHADVLWRNQTTGGVYTWRLNGANVIGAGFTATVADLQWKVVAQGDYDGDGKSDVLWRHDGTGEVYVFLMNGVDIGTAASVATVSDLDWRVAGGGDYDGDGKSDMLWRHATTGDTYIAFMNGAAVLGGGPAGTVADTSWQIVHTR
jgi:hypothetical protein